MTYFTIQFFFLKKFKFMENGGPDVPKYIRGNLRSLLTDEAALPYSWHGHRGNIAVCDFVTMDALVGKSIGILRFKF